MAPTFVAREWFCVCVRAVLSRQSRAYACLCTSPRSVQIFGWGWGWGSDKALSYNVINCPLFSFCFHFLSCFFFFSFVFPLSTVPLHYFQYLPPLNDTCDGILVQVLTFSSFGFTDQSEGINKTNKQTDKEKKELSTVYTWRLLYHSFHWGKFYGTTGADNSDYSEHNQSHCSGVDSTLCFTMF